VRISKLIVADAGQLDAALAEGLAQLSGLYLGDESLEALLDLCVSVARATLAIEGASVTLLRPERGWFETLNATSPEIDHIDSLQYKTGQGPCMQASTTGSVVHAVLAEEPIRWPEFTAVALEHGMASVLSTPLAVRGKVIGALNLYDTHADAFGPQEVATAGRFAAQASVVLANAVAFMSSELANQSLQRALATRDLIGQAKGVLMARSNMTADEAFDVLRRASQRTNRKLHDIATEVVTHAGNPPAPGVDSQP